MGRGMIRTLRAHVRQRRKNMWQGSARYRSAALSVILTSFLYGEAWSADGSVLGVVPEGIVVDASTLGGVQPGGKVEFVRPSTGRTSLGQAAILDVRDDRALVAPPSAGSVVQGDVAVACTGGAGSDDIRQAIKQMQSAGATG